MRSTIIISNEDMTTDELAAIPTLSVPLPALKPL
jgi:hypothetical protein